MKKIILGVLALCVLGLIYACYWSITSDIDFDEMKQEREQMVINRLTQLHDVEEMYKQRFGYYCGNADSIVDFVANGKAIKSIREEGEISDDELKDIIQNGGLSDEEKQSQRAIKRVAIQKGYLISDTTFVSVRDSLKIDDPKHIKYCPVGNTDAVFQIRKNYVYNTMGEAVDLVEIRFSLDDYLKGVPNEAKRIRSVKQDLKKTQDNLPELDDPEYTLSNDADATWYGLRIGDITDENNRLSGNWK